MAVSLPGRGELASVQIGKESSSRQKRIVLEEDDFISAIDAIIERDFFPDIKKLKRQLSNPTPFSDSTSSIRFPASVDSTPVAFETPSIHQASVDSGNDTIRLVSGQASTTTRSRNDLRGDGLDGEDGSKKIKTELSLNAFLAKYTSEDDASFDIIMKEAEERHRAKYPWLYLEEPREDNLALPSTSMQDEPRAIESRSDPKEALTWPYTSRNSLMFIPDGAPVLTEKDFAAFKRPTIVHENTRFSKQPFNERLDQALLAESSVGSLGGRKGKIGIDGREQVSDDLTVGGYGFVPMTPSPMPGVDSTPLMTWGQIEGTPRSVDGGDTPATPRTPHFRIPNVSERDRIAHNLADKMSKNNRDRKKEALRQARSVHSSPLIGSLGSMSPAAQRLATSKLGIGRFADTKLRECYSPSISGSSKGGGKRTSSKS